MESYVHSKKNHVERNCVPSHVAIIMDGNGRWANARGLPRTEGHRKGVETLRRIVRHAGKAGVQILTLFSFSSENWSRPAAEIDFLLALLQRFVQRDLAELHAANIRIKVIGDRHDLQRKILKLIEETETVTRDNTGMELVLAFNYGARNELVRAARSLVADVASGVVDAGAINEATFEAHLDTAGRPDPDLIIRTSGEQRLSNFLLWQAAYSEFYFSPLNWPDFDEEAFEMALKDFAGRERRYGGLSESSNL